MKVNVSIENKDEVFPVPYIGKCGDNVIAYSLFKDKPILMEVVSITTTPTGQYLIHGVKNDVIIPPTIQVTIEFV